MLKIIKNNLFNKEFFLSVFLMIACYSLITEKLNLVLIK